MKLFFKKIFSSPVYVINSPVLNRMGLQRIRIKLKRIDSSKKVDFENHDFNKAYSDLNLNGIAMIENFLMPDEFNRLLSDIKRLSESGCLKNEVGKEGGRVEWEHGNFPLGFSPIIEKKLRQNKDIKKLVEGYTRRLQLSFPEVIFQDLKMPKGCLDNEDVQTVLHADRHYKTIKIFFTVSDHSKENGAFWYCCKSHLMTPERIKCEVDFSIRSSLERTGQLDKLKCSELEKGRAVVNSSLLNNYELMQVTAPGNTLILADVSGFHKRGLIEGGFSRKTIRMIYHYVHAPVLIQIILKLFKREPGRYLN